MLIKQAKTACFNLYKVTNNFFCSHHNYQYDQNNTFKILVCKHQPSKWAYLFPEQFIPSRAPLKEKKRPSPHTKFILQDVSSNTMSILFCTKKTTSYFMLIYTLQRDKWREIGLFLCYAWEIRWLIFKGCFNKSQLN